MNIDREVERIRSEEHCGEYAESIRVSRREVTARPCQVPCQRFGTLNGEELNGNRYVKDDRCNAECPFQDCDNYLPF